MEGWKSAKCGGSAKLVTEFVESLENERGDLVSESEEPSLGRENKFSALTVQQGQFDFCLMIFVSEMLAVSFEKLLCIVHCVCHVIQQSE